MLRVRIARPRRTLAVRPRTSRRVRVSGRRGRAIRPCRSGGRECRCRRSPVRQPGRTGRGACCPRATQGQRRPGRGRGGGEIWWRVHSQVDEDPAVSAADDHPAERVTIVDPLGHPASLAGRCLQSIAGGGNMAALGGGEEVEVLGGPCREVLRAQRCSPASRKPRLAGRAKNILATSSWKGGSPGWPSSAITPPPCRTARPAAPTQTGPPAAGLGRPTGRRAARRRRKRGCRRAYPPA